jgi:hypothetical protein
MTYNTLAKRKSTNNLQYIENTKDRVTRTPLNPVLAVPAPQVTPVGLLFLLCHVMAII